MEVGGGSPWSQDFNPINEVLAGEEGAWGGGGVFAGGKFKFKLFLNHFWYEA